MKLYVMFLTVLAVLMLLAPQTSAGTLYGIGDWGELYLIDTQTGGATFLGDTIGGSTNMRGMDYGDGVMYGCSHTGGLVTIDLSTAVGTCVGPSPGIYGISGLAYNTSDGYLYATRSAHTPTYLFRLDPATGNATEVGEHGVWIGGLAYDSSSSTLLATSNFSTSSLYTVDPQTAACTLVGSTGFGWVNGLTFAPDTGTLYGVSEPFGTSTLMSIDLATGVGTAIGPTGVGIFGLGYVPEPSSFILLATGALGLLVCARRKKR